MERWRNKVAVVTGASSGIGETVAASLIEAGFVVAALARRQDRLLENQRKLPLVLQSYYHPVKCDVSDENDVKKAFEWIDKNLGGTDVLVNNAGVAHFGVELSALDNSQVVRNTINVNVLAVVFCVREAFNSMKKRNFDGHIVVVNSVAGHKVPILTDPLNVYPGTKHAVTAMIETYRQEFANAGAEVKITSVSPGAVFTEIVGDPLSFKDSGIPYLNPEDVSNAILYAIGTPSHVQIHEIMIRPVGESF